MGNVNMSALTVLDIKAFVKSIRFLNFTKVDVNICIDYFWILYSCLVQPFTIA